VLLEAGAKPVPNHKGKTPLMEAAYAYHENGLEVELLIEAGDNVNARDRQGRTALLYAYENGSISDGAIVRALIERGAHGNSMPGCGLLKNVFLRLDGDEDIEEEEEEIPSHRMHILLLRATLPVMPLDGEEYERLQACEEEVHHNLASTCLAVHQAHFRFARAVFVAARSCIQLVRTYFSGVDSPIALALVAVYSAEERAAARANPMTEIHRPRRDVRFEHVQSESALREHSTAQGCEPFLNIQEAAERVARFAFDLNNTATLPENERNECGLNMALWYTYLNIPLSVGVTS
jgi:Ankyrin repeats (3 copies)